MQSGFLNRTPILAQILKAIQTKNPTPNPEPKTLNQNAWILHPSCSNHEPRHHKIKTMENHI